MSRSFKKNPFCGMSCAESEKKDKQRYNRKFRRIDKQSIKKQDDMLLTSVKEVSNPWAMDKDGKQRFRKDVHPDLMRK